MTFTYRLSLAANIVLGAIVAVMLWRGQPIAPAPAAASAPVVPATQTAPLSSEAMEAVAEAPPPAPAQFEQAGISRRILVTALLEDFHHRWDQRFAGLEKQYAPKAVPEREYVELARQRDAEQIDELKAALGEAGYLAWDKDQTLRRLNSTGLPLTAEEADQAYRLQKEFEEEHQGLQRAMEDGFADPADAATLQTQAQATLDRELSKLLGEQRVNAMRGLSDPIADVYRAYGDLNPTPDQASAVLRAEGDHRTREAALARRLNENPGSAGNVAADLKALSDAQDENLRRIFGAEAYDAMKRQNDPTYKTLRQYAEAWALQDHEIQSVYETLHAFNDQARRTRSAAEMRQAAGQSVNWPEINSAIELARQQTEAGLQNLIGAERLRRLKQNGLLTSR